MDMKQCQHLLEKSMMALRSGSLGLGPQMCCSPSLDASQDNETISVPQNCLGCGFGEPSTSHLTSLTLDLTES